MKLLFDYIPIVLFFLTYWIAKLYTDTDAFYIATAAAIIASALQISLYWLISRKFEKLHVLTFLLVLVLGVPTLLLHDPLFFKWKPTAIYWLFAVAFLISQFIGKKNLLQRMMDNKVELPKKSWRNLNFSWVIFFVIMGFINVYVVYNFSTNFWVNFKLFGTLILTFIFVVIQGLFMAKHIQHKPAENK